MHFRFLIKIFKISKKIFILIWLFFRLFLNESEENSEERPPTTRLPTPLPVTLQHIIRIPRWNTKITFRAWISVASRRIENSKIRMLRLFSCGFIFVVVFMLTLVFCELNEAGLLRLCRHNTGVFCINSGEDGFHCRNCWELLGIVHLRRNLKFRGEF